MPARYGTLGLSRHVLSSHVAWDPGARRLARDLQRRLGCPYVEAHYSRLLVDLNRSAAHPRLIPGRAFGVEVPGNRDLDRPERERRRELYWRPYRKAVVVAVAGVVQRGRLCLHVAVHSFVPELRGRLRSCDIGLLFDPQRDRERDFAEEARRALRCAGFKVRFNYPYRGTSDGLTTALRREFAPDLYAGVELEVNQALARHRWSAVARTMAAVLAGVAGVEAGARDSTVVPRSRARGATPK